MFMNKNLHVYAISDTTYAHGEMGGIAVHKGAPDIVG